MNYRKLGNTDILASEIGMGSEGFVGMERADALRLIASAIEGGVNYFDLYNPQPEVREALGRGVAAHRADVSIQGHLCTAWLDGQYVRTRDLKQTQAAFETMMHLLGTDYLDVGMLHYIDSEADFQTVFHGPLIDYALQLQRSGRIRYLGVSSHNPVIARKIVETGLIQVVLFAVNPAYDMQPASENLELLWADESYVEPLRNIDPDRDAFHKLCALKGVGITVMKAFGGGDLLDASLSPFGVAMTPAQCIHYALSRPGVASVLGGFRTQEQLEQSLLYSFLPDAARDFAPVLSRVPKHTFYGKCMYCGHCAPCSVGIDVASVNKFHDLCVAQGFVPETVREHYAALPHRASECVACGQCAKNCPFGVDIISAMQKAAALFGD